MAVQLYMFGSLVKYWISCYMDGRKVVTMELSRLRMRNQQCIQSVPQPSDFRRCGCHGSILFLSRGPRNNTLLLDFSGNE